MESGIARSNSGKLLQIALHGVQQRNQQAFVVCADTRHGEFGELLTLALHIQVHGVCTVAQVQAGDAAYCMPGM